MIIHRGEAWQSAQVEAALSEADAGDFVPEKDLTSSPTLALRVTGGGFPLLGDSCSRSTGFLLHRAA